MSSLESESTVDTSSLIMKLGVIVLAVVMSAGTLSPHCAKYCRSRHTSQMHLPWDPQCNCFPNEGETVNTLLVAKKPTILKYHENGIYYEPPELYPGEKISYFNQPFYILNPVADIYPKHRNHLIDAINIASKDHESKLKKESETMKRRRKEHKMLEKLNTKKPHAYLDVNLGEQKAEVISGDTSYETAKEWHKIEHSLSECLDLHILAMSRRNNNVSELLKSWSPIKFQKFDNLNNEDLIKAIDNTCREPAKYVEKSLSEIIQNWSNKKPFNNTSKNIDKDILYVLSDTNASMPLNNTFVLPNDLDAYKTTSNKAIVKSKSTAANNDVINKASERTDYRMFKKKVSLHLQKSGDVLIHNDTKVTLLNRSTMIKNDTLRKSNFFTQTHPTIVDTTLTTPVSSQNFRNFSTTSLDGLINKNVAIRDDNKIINNINVKSPKILENNVHVHNSNMTGSSTEINTFNRKQVSPKRLSGYNSNYQDPYKEVKNSSSQFMGINDDKYHQMTMEYLSRDISDNSNQSLVPTSTSKPSHQEHNGSVTIIYPESRQTYNESEVPLQRVITREFSNNTILSIINGTEDLPNNDFRIHVDKNTTSQTSNLNITTENVLNYTSNKSKGAPLTELFNRIALEETTEKVSDLVTNPVISGKLYFLFDQEHIPAKFVQRSDGKIHVGIDGPTLCNKSSYGQESQFSILTTLCNCAQFNNCSKKDNS